MTTVPFWGPDFSALAAEDPQIADILLSELERARSGLQLIASENFTSPAVLAALGSTLSNKYAEGYPGKRYYGGCAEVDKAEIIGIERAKELFGAEHANLQPHSGASANIAAYGAFVAPIVIGDQIKAGTPQYAMYGFAVFYAACLVLNWWFYLRGNAYVKNP